MMIEAPALPVAVAPTLQPGAEVTGCQRLWLITQAGPGGAPTVPLQASQPRLPQIAGSTSKTRPPMTMRASHGAAPSQAGKLVTRRERVELVIDGLGAVLLVLVYSG